MFYAHSADRVAHWEPLELHLRLVAQRATRYAEPLGAADEAQLAGLLHDLGKYSERFTERLLGRASGLDHWSIGAFAALLQWRGEGIAAALAIQGHHIGLQCCGADCSHLEKLHPPRIDSRELHPLKLKLSSADHGLLLRRLVDDDLVLPTPVPSLMSRMARPLERMLAVRLLFSTLVDADFVETEAHFAGQATGERIYRDHGPELHARQALQLLNNELDRLGQSGGAAAAVQGLRADLLEACRRSARGQPGLYTLTAPTGAGKTLAMLAFALEHARRHGLRRIVLTVPYLSIIEQTAQVYRDLFAETLGPDYVLEHHSLAILGEPQDDKPSRSGPGPSQRDLDLAPHLQRLSENWDAPLVLTTNVQLLESLFAHRPARCRKLHRLAGSVILLDEVQSLPPHLALPTLGTLSSLAQHYGCTVLFSTATQPAFEHLHQTVQDVWATGGWRPTEIAKPALGLFQRLRRTRVHWDLLGEDDVPRRHAWEEVAAQALEADQVLVILNLKRHARHLAQLLRTLGAGDGLLHLSTNMCPAHRLAVLGEVRRRLKRDLPCRLISTQCVEAGVDLDFPAVFRAFGPLEAIAQAAGRCNRNGSSDEPGLVWVFEPDEDGLLMPGGSYQQLADAGRSLLRELGQEAMDLQDPELFRRYYRLFYELTDTPVTGAEGLKELIDNLDFPAVAAGYRLIDADTIDVLVPYQPEVTGRLIRELETRRYPGRGWLREARQHAVALYRPRPGDELLNVLDPLSFEDRDEGKAQWFRLLTDEAYDRELLGLVEVEGLWIA